MKKLVTLTLVFALMATAAMASGTRLRTMGDAHMIVKDAGNIWMFPSTIVMYQDQAEAVINYDNDPYNSPNYLGEHLRRVGAHFTFNKNTNPFVLGVYITNDDLSSHSFFIGPPTPSSYSFGFKSFEYNSNRSLNLFFGKQLGNNPFGVHLKALHSSWSDNDNAGLENHSYTYIKVNVGMTTNGGMIDWALALWMQTWKYEDAAGSIFDPKGNFGARFAIRRFTGMWVWHGKLSYDKQGAEDPNANIEGKFTQLCVDLGIGLNYSVTSSAMFVADFGVALANEKYEETDANTPANDYDTKFNRLTLPYWKVGMDGRVFDWADLRFGATNYVNRLKAEDNFSGGSYEEKDNGNDVNAYVGAGFHFGALVIDAWMNAEWFLFGPDFVGGTGAYSSGPMFGEVTLTYMLAN